LGDEEVGRPPEGVAGLGGILEGEQEGEDHVQGYSMKGRLKETER
jgi:hypothetical protein